jgi:hypothetical protein
MSAFPLFTGAVPRGAVHLDCEQDLVVGRVEEEPATGHHDRSLLHEGRHACSRQYPEAPPDLELALAAVGQQVDQLRQVRPAGEPGTTSELVPEVHRSAEPTADRRDGRGSHVAATERSRPAPRVDDRALDRGDRQAVDAAPVIERSSRAVQHQPGRPGRTPRQVDGGVHRTRRRRHQIPQGERGRVTRHRLPPLQGSSHPDVPAGGSCRQREDSRSQSHERAGRHPAADRPSADPGQEVGDRDPTVPAHCSRHLDRHPDRLRAAAPR